MPRKPLAQQLAVAVGREVEQQAAGDRRDRHDREDVRERALVEHRARRRAPRGCHRFGRRDAARTARRSAIAASAGTTNAMCQPAYFSSAPVTTADSATPRLPGEAVDADRQPRPRRALHEHRNADRVIDRRKERRAASAPQPSCHAECVSATSSADNAHAEEEHEHHPAPAPQVAEPSGRQRAEAEHRERARRRRASGPPSARSRSRRRSRRPPSRRSAGTCGRSRARRSAAATCARDSGRHVMTALRAAGREFQREARAHVGNSPTGSGLPT